MATRIASNPSLVMNENGGVIRTASCLSDGSATWKQGEFLRLASDGLLYEGTTSAASGVGDDAITHYALTDLDTATTGVDTNARTVGRVLEDDIFEINELDGTVTQAQIGQHYGMDVTSNLCTLNASITSHPVFQVVRPTWLERPYQDDSSDILARLTVKVLATAINATPSN